MFASHVASAALQVPELPCLKPDSSTSLGLLEFTVPTSVLIASLGARLASAYTLGQSRSRAHTFLRDLVRKVCATQKFQAVVRNLSTLEPVEFDLGPDGCIPGDYIWGESPSPFSLQARATWGSWHVTCLTYDCF